MSPTGQHGGAEAALLEMLAGLSEALPGLAVERGGGLGRARSWIAPARSAWTWRCCRFRPVSPRWGNGGPGRRWSVACALAASCLIAAGAALGYAWRLRRVVASSAPDIVQSNGVKMHLLAAWVAPRAAAVVWHVHDYVGTRAVTSRALRWMARLV